MTQFNKNQILEIHNKTITSPIGELYHNMVNLIHGNWAAEKLTTTIEDTIDSIIRHNSKFWVYNPKTGEIYNEIFFSDILTGNANFDVSFPENSTLVCPW